MGLSIFGTYVSSIGFLGNTDKAFGSNWNSWAFGLTLPLFACNNNNPTATTVVDEVDTPQWVTPAETTAPTPMGDDDSAN